MESPGVNSEEVIQNTARAIIEYLLVHPNTSKRVLSTIKGQIGKKFHYISVIKDSYILKHATPAERMILEPLLRRRFTRTLSGVTIVAVMAAPNPAGGKSCPGECVFCPGADSQPGEKVAQSYTGREPAAMRSIMFHYDPYEQTLSRLMDLKAIGHNVDKIELIIMGGTFLYAPVSYQMEFIKGCFDAIINFQEPDYNQHCRTETLEIAKQQLECAKTRLIGVTFETRPDFCRPEHVDRMLELGGTRVEIGIQSTQERLLHLSHRNHTLQDNIDAIRVAKDAGLKVNAHMMPNLPGSSPENDVQIFRTLFSDPHFRPDMLKIYPTLVVAGTQLYNQYQKGEYRPYSQDQVIEVIAQIKPELPNYVRIQRIQRDIPENLIIAGVKNSNLRQLVQAQLEKQNKRCNCIRCREEGFYANALGVTQSPIDLSFVKIYQEEYEASEGREFFLSFEDRVHNFLVGYLRLRLPSSRAHRPEINLERSAIIREIRVVGEIVHHSEDPKVGQIQHRGYGKKLMEAAEDLASSLQCNKILVIAGIGVRPYFYRMGYILDGPYVSKKLESPAF